MKVWFYLSYKDTKIIFNVWFLQQYIEIFQYRDQTWFSIHKHSQGPEGGVENWGRSPRFQHLPRVLANVNEWQNHVWSLLLHKFKENTPEIEKMFAHFILQPYHHFLTHPCFYEYPRSGLGQVLFIMMIWRLSMRFVWQPGECINIIQ